MIRITELKSGVRLITERMEGVRSVAAGIWCNTGSSNEKPEEYGISHYIEHMLFKGTVNRTPFEIVDCIDSLGGELNAFTGKETTCFYVKCLEEHLRQSCDVLCDLIENPLFDPVEMEKEKKVVIEEINMNADDPDDVAIDELERIIFDGSAYAHPVLGSRETVASFSRDLVCDYYYSHYTRDNLVVSVAGYFDEDEIIGYFAEKFGGLKEHARKDIRSAADTQPVNSRITKDIEQAHLAIGIQTVPAKDENRYRLSILSSILGGGMSSRLFQSIREERGLCYSIYSMNGFYSETGAFSICSGIASDRVDEAIDAIHAELDKLAKEPVTEKEFLSSKEQLKSNYIFSQESAKSRMTANGRNFLALGKCQNQDEVIKLIDDITIEDIENAKHLISDFDRYSIVNVTGNK